MGGRSSVFTARFPCDDTEVQIKRGEHRFSVLPAAEPPPSAPLTLPSEDSGRGRRGGQLQPDDEVGTCSPRKRARTGWTPKEIQALQKLEAAQGKAVANGQINWELLAQQLQLAGLHSNSAWPQRTARLLPVACATFLCALQLLALHAQRLF